MSEPAVVAIDQGTTGSTVLVVGQDGRILGRAYSEFTQHYPQPGWVEHDAAEIWAVTARVAREALESTPEAREARLEAVGITNQRETLVVWDRETLEPAHRAIVWQDRRTTGICRELKAAGHEMRVRERTGLVLDPYFTGTKLTWLLRNEPELRARAEAGELAAGTVDAWLMARLTGGAHVTDATNASRTLLYDIHEGTWSDELLTLLEVPAALLPEVKASSADFGVASGEFLGKDLPILGVAGDQQAALFGQGCWGPGLAKNTYGTGAFLLLHTGKEPVHSQAGLLTTVAADAHGQPAYALEGAIFIAGAAIQWLRDELGILDDSRESEALAEGLEGNDGVYFVPAFVGMGAPHWEPDARGMLVGLTRGSGRAHLARAALEAMAYQTADVLSSMERDSGLHLAELRVDGGAAANDWLMRFQAGLLGVPVRRPALVETTAFGAAGLAGLRAGVWDSPEAFLQAREAPTLFSPEMPPGHREELREGWRRAVSTALHWTRWEGGRQGG